MPVRLDDDGESLPDVEHRHPERARSRRRGTHDEEREEREEAERAPRHAARRREHDDAGERDSDRPARRRVLLPGRGRHRGERVERNHQRRECGVRDVPQRVDRHDDRREREGHDRERDDRNRQRVGHRRDERHLLEQRERAGDEGDRDDRLGACGRTQRPRDAREQRYGRR